jgi:Fe-S-cluster containining protein
MPVTAPTSNADKDVRRFACTSCGKCCDRGPEMALSEATALADRFITSAIFKIHSLPINERSESAVQWWQSQGSRIPMRPALEESRRHLSQFASRKRAENRRERQVFLTISAIVNDDGRGRCPALRGNLCGVYEIRPLTCRTVPMHYSRPPSMLGSYLDNFTNTPEYLCDTSQAAPAVLDRNTIISPTIRQYREDAINLAKAERAWKEQLVVLMDDPERAKAAELPTYDAILENTDNGYATLLPMIVPWRVARNQGILSSEALEDICRKQVSLIKTEIERSPEDHLLSDLRDTLAVYEFELSKARSSEPSPAFLARPFHR